MHTILFLTSNPIKQSILLRYVEEEAAAEAAAAAAIAEVIAIVIAC